jgi:hypothetical protein
VQAAERQRHLPLLLGRTLILGALAPPCFRAHLAGPDGQVVDERSWKAAGPDLTACPADFDQNPLSERVSVQVSYRRKLTITLCGVTVRRDSEAPMPVIGTKGEGR